MNQWGKVAVLYGGIAAEREVSLRSGAAVLAGLKSAGVNAHGIDTQKTPLSQLKEQGFSCAFIVVHGRGGEDGTLQGALETLGIPYTGSRVLGSALAMDKTRSKQIWQALELPTAPYRQVSKNDYTPETMAELLQSLGGRAFVKPVHEGSSIGIEQVTSIAELTASVEHAFVHDSKVLIESYIDGPEYTVSIVAGETLPAIELRTQRGFYDYAAKYESGDTQYLCPCELSETARKELNRICLQAFNALGCEGWGRVDVMRQRSGEFQLLEVNTVPGMTQTSLVPKAGLAAGFNFEQLLLRILELAY